MRDFSSRLFRFCCVILMLVGLQACAAFKRPPLPPAPSVERASPANDVIKVVYSRHFTERFLPTLPDDVRLSTIRRQAEILSQLFCRNDPIIHQEDESSEIIGLGEQQWYRIYKLVECDFDFEAMAEARRSMDWRAVLYAGMDLPIGSTAVSGDLYQFGFSEEPGRMDFLAATSIQSGNYFVYDTRYIQEILTE